MVLEYCQFLRIDVGQGNILQILKLIVINTENGLRFDLYISKDFE